jgi:hypothetical protein
MSIADSIHKMDRRSTRWTERNDTIRRGVVSIARPEAQPVRPALSPDGSGVVGRERARESLPVSLLVRAFAPARVDQSRPTRRTGEVGCIARLACCESCSTP